jgi:small subunit ribosomal protein S1
MEAQYDDKGEYIYPEGFDPDTQEWREGFDAQREEWEKRYAAARERFEAHKKQLEDAQKADAAAATESGEATSYSSDVPAESEDGGGTLASDEALAALREKLAGR